MTGAGLDLEFCIALILVGDAAVRVARNTTDRLGARILCAITGGGAIAIGESLALGLVTLGTNRVALLVASFVIAIAVRVGVPSDNPPVRSQVLAWWREVPLGFATAIGVLVGAVGALGEFMFAMPRLGIDALAYHLQEPAEWMFNGRPGSLVGVSTIQPDQAFPKSGEVLFSWIIAFVRNDAEFATLSIAIFAVTAAALGYAMRVLGASRLMALAGAFAIAVIPIEIASISNGPSTDALALAWVAVSGATAAVSIREPRVFGYAALAGLIAAGTKTTAIPVVVLGLVGVAWVLRHRMSRFATVAGVAAGVGVGGLWYVQDLIVYGSPLWPFSRIPFGRPQPYVIRIFASFASNPSGTLKITTADIYFRLFPAGLILVAAMVVLVPFALRSAGRTRPALLAAGLGVVSAAAWALSPGSGEPEHVRLPGPLLASNIRYLLPGVAAALLAVTLISRTNRVARWLAGVALLAADVADLIEGRHLGSIYRPDAAATGLGALAGAVVFMSLVIAGRRLRLPSLARSVPSSSAGTGTRRVGLDRAAHGREFAIGLGLAVVVAAGALTISQHGYFARQQRYAFAKGVSDQPVLSWFADQPGWLHGGRQIWEGEFMDSRLAGPSFENSTHLIESDTTCAELSSDARIGYVVITDEFGRLVALPFDKARCFGQQPPAFTGNGFRVWTDLPTVPHTPVNEPSLS